MNDRVLGDHLAGAHEEKLEKPQFARRNFDRYAAGGKAACIEIQRDVAVADDRTAQPGLAPEQDPDARLELADIERLDQVIVGTEVEALHPFFGRAARRQDQHGRPVLPGPHGAQHVEPIHLRQVQVQDDQIEALGRGDGMRGSAIIHHVDGVATVTQEGREALCQGLIVFNEQDSQLSRLPAPPYRSRPCL